MRFRWLTALSATFIVCVLIVVAGPAAVGAGPVGCAPYCGGGPASVHRQGQPEPLACIHDAGCGGGAALGLGMGAGLALLVGTAPSVAGVIGVWRRRLFTSRQPVSVLLASGLFRPPRLLLDV